MAPRAVVNEVKRRTRASFTAGAAVAAEDSVAGLEWLRRMRSGVDPRNSTVSDTDSGTLAAVVNIVGFSTTRTQSSWGTVTGAAPSTVEGDLATSSEGV